MEYKEYGSKNNDIIILLHGGGLSWWNYIDEISLLENEFHIVIPILDGHSGSDTNFTSIESNALEIINFINKNYNGKVKLIGGLSLGGQILLEILSKNPDICECAIIESALVMPMDFTYKMIEPIFNLSYCLISKNLQVFPHLTPGVHLSAHPAYHQIDLLSSFRFQHCCVLTDTEWL